MILSDLPPREQERFLDGITVGIGTREVGRPRQALAASYLAFVQLVAIRM